MFLSLPPECHLLVILAACSDYSHVEACRCNPGFINRRTLSSLLLLCKQVNQVITKYCAQIEEHYIIKIRTGCGLRYEFCGLFHQINDLPAVVWNDNTRWWCRYGKLHRSIVYDANGKLLYGGPAVIRSDGSKAWYYHGMEINTLTPPNTMGRS